MPSCCSANGIECQRWRLSLGRLPSLVPSPALGASRAEGPYPLPGRVLEQLSPSSGVRYSLERRDELEVRHRRRQGSLEIAVLKAFERVNSRWLFHLRALGRFFGLRVLGGSDHPTGERKVPTYQGCYIYSDLEASARRRRI